MPLKLHGESIIILNKVSIIDDHYLTLFRHLIYTGQLELGDAHRPAGVRTCIITACSQNLMECLKELGFT